MSTTIQKLPSWTIESINNNYVPKTEDFLGKPLLLLFFSLHCPGCVGRAIPFANRIALEYADKVNVVGIHTTFEGPELSDDEIEHKMKELYARFPYYRDAGLSTTFYDYQAAGTPHWILANENGIIIKDIFGSDPNRALFRLDLALTELLNKIL
jgi:thiol-disulfide isomerase/thioredoxin